MFTLRYGEVEAEPRDERGKKNIYEMEQEKEANLFSGLLVVETQLGANRLFKRS